MPRLRFVSTVQGVSTIELVEPIITIGRVANNVVCIEDPNISKHHTLLVSEDDTYKIYDLHSVNGTWINGEKITVGKLKEGDVVRIGYLELKYEIATPTAAPKPVVVPAAPASKTATGPTMVPARPKLGFKPAGAPAAAPVVVPVVGAAPAAPIAVSPPPTPVKEEPRSVIRLPEEKKATGPKPPVAPPAEPPQPILQAPPPPPVPPPAPAAPLPEPAPQPESVEPAPAATATTLAPKKFGASPSGGPKLKPFSREPAQPAPAPTATTPETPAEAAPAAESPESPPASPAAPTTGPKKLGAAPGGGPPKFKLKRE